MLLFDSWKKTADSEINSSVRSSFASKIYELLYRFLIKLSDYSYYLAGIFILIVILDLIYIYKRNREEQQGPQVEEDNEELNSNERPSVEEMLGGIRELLDNSARAQNRRRPGATFRQHETFRNIWETVHEYMQPATNNIAEAVNEVRRTRSGAVYGRYD